MLYDQTRDYILNLRDEELTQYILDGTALYEPDAVAFAQAQFDSRGLDRELIAPREVQARAETRIQEELARSAEAAERSLSTVGTAFYFLAGACSAFPAVLLGWWWMSTRGERTKIKQMFTIALIGFGLTLAIIFTLSWLGAVKSK